MDSSRSWRSGLRIQEALALTEGDLDHRRGSLLVRRGTEVSPSTLEQAVAGWFVIELVVDTPPYLHHVSEIGEFWLSSDAVIPSFSRESWLTHIIDQIPDVEREAFQRLGYTVGGMMVFPANRVGRKMTINGARGFHPRIKDRVDLTLECIRRRYLDEPSPLSDTLARYADFFALFDDFAGYVEFFHLQDLASQDALAVEFFMPFEDFAASPLPGTSEEYVAYRPAPIRFIEARNRRIAADVTALGR